MQEKKRCLSLGGKDPLEEDMVTHSSILAWSSPWTDELGGLQSTGSQGDTAETERRYNSVNGV